jgi:putative membrane protein
MPQPDPRIFFAAERTLLAWLRTGLTVIGLGFVVARFGLLLRVLAAQSHGAYTQARSEPSGALGVLFVLIGTIAVLGATVQHRRFISTLPPSELPPAYSRTFALLLSGVVGLLGLLLAGYLLVSPM